MINLVKINSYEELFSISVILINEKFFSSVIKIILDFIKSNKELDIKNRIIIMYLLDKSDYFIKEIDIIEDIKIIDFLMENITELIDNLYHINEIDNCFNTDTFKKTISTFLITRILIIDSNEKVSIINKVIKTNLNFDFNNLK